MFAALLTIHTLLRWVVLLALVARVGRGAQAVATGASWERFDRILSGAALGLTHLQVLLGIVMYFLSPTVSAGLADMGAAMKDSAIRFWVVEHPFTMILGAIAVQVGFSVSRRASTDAAQHRWALIGYGLGLLLIVAGIPWSLRDGF